eukprot:SAG25_NODE_6193_length_580_cov_0.887734_1_plen_94_part_10
MSLASSHPVCLRSLVSAVLQPALINRPTVSTWPPAAAEATYEYQQTVRPTTASLLVYVSQGGKKTDPWPVRYKARTARVVEWGATARVAAVELG